MNKVLHAAERRLGNKTQSSKSLVDEWDLLERELTRFAIPFWLKEIFLNYGLVGKTISISEEIDLSGFGAEMQWMSPSQVVGEAKESYPGEILYPRKFFPFGSCLIGTGDPYFLRLDEDPLDPPVVRCPHASVINDTGYDFGAIEIVSKSLSDFISCAEIDA